jgi:hypothetical protein
MEGTGMDVDFTEPQLHYSCINEGLSWTREFLTLALTTVSALGDGDTGMNLEFEQWHSLFRLLHMLDKTLAQIHKDYQAACE